MDRQIRLAFASIGCALVVTQLGGCEENEVGTRQAAKGIPAGSLELRILASRTLDIPNDFDSLVRELGEHGPKGRSHHAFAWYEVADGVIFLDVPELVISDWQGRRFILASTAPERVLDRRTSWKVTSFELVRYEHLNSAAVVFELDKAGGKQLEALTTANLKRQLGIFLFGKLESFATVMDVIAERISLSGHQESMDRLHDKLQKIAQSP